MNAWYSVLPIYRGRVYRGIGYIAAHFFGPQEHKTKWQVRQRSPQKYMASSWLIYAQTALTSAARFCNATSYFDKCHYIRCLHAGFAAKHTKAPLSLLTRWRMESDFWLMTVALYIALPLTSRYHCLDPTNRDISRVHCVSVGIPPANMLQCATTQPVLARCC